MMTSSVLTILLLASIWGLALGTERHEHHLVAWLNSTTIFLCPFYYITTWWNKNGQITNKPRFLIFDNAGDQSNQMVIEELTREDEGMYQCEYKSRAAHTFHLKVVPVRQKPIVVKAYNEGEPPKLVCKSHGGFPAPVVTWGDADVGTRFRMAGEEVIQDYNIDSTIDVAEFLQLAHVTEARITCYATWPEMLFDNYHQAMNYISYNLSSDGLTPPIFLNHSTLYKYTHEDVHNHISNQADAITEEEALSKHMTPLIWGIVGCAAVAVIVLITCYFIARSKKTKGNRIFKADHDPISVVYHDNI